MVKLRAMTLLMCPLISACLLNFFIINHNKIIIDNNNNNINYKPINWEHTIVERLGDIYLL